MKFRKALCSVLVLLLLALQTAVVADPYIPEEMTIIKAADIGSQNISLDGVSKVSDISKLKSSNKKVATVSTFTYLDMVYIGISPKNPGKSTITFNYKYGGKTYKGKVKVTVLDYENPFKSIKIGSKNYSSRFRNQQRIEVDKALSGKLTINLKKGYTLQSLYSYNYKDGEDFQILSENKKIKIRKGHRLEINVLDENGAYRVFYIDVRE